MRRQCTPRPYLLGAWSMSAGWFCRSTFNSLKPFGVQTKLNCQRCHATLIKNTTTGIAFAQCFRHKSRRLQRWINISDNSTDAFFRDLRAAFERTLCNAPAETLTQSVLKCNLGQLMALGHSV